MIENVMPNPRPTPPPTTTETQTTTRTTTTVAVIAIAVLAGTAALFWTSWCRRNPESSLCRIAGSDKGGISSDDMQGSDEKYRGAGTAAPAPAAAQPPYIKEWKDTQAPAKKK